MKIESKSIKGFIIFALILIIIVALAFFMFATIDVEGKSMQPTIEDGDKIFLIRKFVEYKKGDVVVFIGSDNKALVKRIIATEGDTVELKKDENGTFRYYVNSVLVEDEYVNLSTYTSPTATKFEYKIVVPDDEFFYLGDNRLVSKDSSEISKNDDGTLSVTFGVYENIIGKVLFRYNFDGKFVVKGVE